MTTTALAHQHLMTLTLAVDFAGMLNIGPVPAGRRRIAPVTGGGFTGPRLAGSVLPGGADWVINRADGVMLIDVRLTLKTDDGALLYLAYRGRFLAGPEAMARFGKGALLEAGEYSLAVSARLECGDPGYVWVNDLIIVGTGKQTRSGPIYDLFAIG